MRGLKKSFQPSVPRSLNPPPPMARRLEQRGHCLLLGAGPGHLGSGVVALQYVLFCVKARHHLWGHFWGCTPQLRVYLCGTEIKFPRWSSVHTASPIAHCWL